MASRRGRIDLKGQKGNSKVHPRLCGVAPNAYISDMPARKPPDPNEKPQRERFIEAAREHGASEDPEEFERIFRRVVKPPQIPAQPMPKVGKKAG
jgi:hypothetical protein